MDWRFELAGPAPLGQKVNAILAQWLYEGLTWLWVHGHAPMDAMFLALRHAIFG